MKKSDIMNLRMLAYLHGGKKFKLHGKGAGRDGATSLVVLLILNSYTNHAKVKTASTSSH